MYIKKLEEKAPGKVGECIFDSYKCKSFQCPKVGPGPWPIFAHQLSFAKLAKSQNKNSAPPCPNPGSTTVYFNFNINVFLNLNINKFCNVFAIEASCFLFFFLYLTNDRTFHLRKVITCKCA